MADDKETSVETAGGRSVLICLDEARNLLVRLCAAPARIVDLRTADGRAAFVASVDAQDAARFVEDPRAAGMVLGRE